MKKKTIDKILATLVTVLAAVSITIAADQYLPDIIVTSPDGIWTDTRAYATFDDALTAVGSNVREVYILREEAMTSGTINANTTLKFRGLGAINNSGQLTINTRNIDSDDNTRFTGSGDIDFAVGSVVRSSWFSGLYNAITLTNDDWLTLVISEQSNITGNCSVGDQVTLKWESSRNRIIVNSGYTLSNIKNIQAGPYQLFAGAGDLDFLDGTELKLSWFYRLRSVLHWVESEEVNIVIDKSEDLDYSDTVDSNESLYIIPGNVLDGLSGTETLTINGGISASPRARWIGDSLNLAGSPRIEKAYVEWAGVNTTPGTTDMTTPGQTIIDWLYNAGGGTVQLLEDTYLCNWVIKNKMTIRGVSAGSTILKPATDDAVIKTPLTESTTNIIIERLQIDGTDNKATYTSQDGIRLKTTTASTWVDTINISNVFIQDCGRYGLYTYGTSTSGPFVQNLSVESSIITDNTDQGLYIDGELLEASFYRCKITSNGSNSATNAESINNAFRRGVFIGCQFNSSGYTPGDGYAAIKLSGARQISFIGCNFEESDYMIHTINALSKNLSVIGCKFGSTSNVTAAIWVQDIDGLMVKNSHFTSSGTMTNAIMSGSATARTTLFDIGLNNYINVTKPIDYNFNLTISSGAISITQKHHMVETEGAAASDDLDNIYDAAGAETALAHGDTITIRPLNGTHTVVVKHDTGNIYTNTGADINLDELYKSFSAKWDETLGKWLQI